MSEQPIISLQNLNKTFTSRSGSEAVEALHNISLNIMRGDIYGIIGLSGAGKSTLVRCINYLEKPTGGKVFFEGEELGTFSEKKLREVRKSIGMIFQSFNLLEQRTALENILFPLELVHKDKNEAKIRAEELLEIVGLADRAGNYPSQLSGGQKQRVAIARALANNPSVILCDEATSALDPNTTDSILTLLRDININLGVTIVVITHEMRVIEKICNKVAVIADGLIAEEGLVSDVFSSPKTEIARQLVFTGSESISAVNYLKGNKALRIVFDGNSSFEPIISNMTIECRTPVNILFADTRDIDGSAHGQMIIGLPDDEAAQQRILTFLESRNIRCEEV